VLCITRRIGEGVLIGSNVRVVVLDVHKGHVKLGFEAPTDIAILRDEVAFDSSRHNARNNGGNDRAEARNP
jgi:carbon storage regulator